MRHFLTIFGHEIRMLLLNPSTYIAAVLFLGFMGFVFMGILENYARAAQDVSPAIAFFSLFFLPAWLIVPMLTMRSLAEERRAGTLETLLTAPVKAAEVVFGKFFASYLLYLLLWLSTLGFVFVLNHFAKDPRLLDTGPLVGGYLFVAVSSLLYIAIGTFASAVSRTQSVSGILAFVLLLAVTIGPWKLGEATLLQQETLHPVRDALDSINVFHHLDDFTRGVVDTRQIVFYFTGTALALIFSILGVEAKILRS